MWEENRVGDEKLPELLRDKERLDDLQDAIEKHERMINSAMEDLYAAAAGSQDEELKKMADSIQEKAAGLRYLTFNNISLVRDGLDDKIKKLKNL